MALKGRSITKMSLQPFHVPTLEQRARGRNALPFLFHEGESFVASSPGLMIADFTMERMSARAVGTNEELLQFSGWKVTLN